MENFDKINEYEQGFDKELKFELVSLIAYLIGVDKHVFEMETQPPKMEIYEELEKNRNAKIVRSLCRLRTSIEMQYYNCTNAIIHDGRSLFAMKEYLPIECFDYLSREDIKFSDKEHKNTNLMIIALNNEIRNRINNCQDLNHFIKWEYIYKLFIMPNGDTVRGIEIEGAKYKEYRKFYPYSNYIYWNPTDVGNMLESDSKFCYLLYKWNNDNFVEYNKVRDVGKDTKEKINKYLDTHENIHLVVDCENSNPYRLFATINGLQDDYKGKISKIILIDDPHTSETWNKLEDYIDIPIKYIEVERLKEEKSLVDQEVEGECYDAYYKEGVKAFIMVASDSDYWPLIKRLSDADFLFFVEHEKCSPELKEALITKGIDYCFIDDFYSGDSNYIIYDILMKNIRNEIKEKYSIDLNDLLYRHLRDIRAELNENEKKYIFEKYLRSMKINIDDNKILTLEIKQ